MMDQWIRYRKMAPHFMHLPHLFTPFLSIRFFAICLICHLPASRHLLFTPSQYQAFPCRKKKKKKKEDEVIIS